jgi:hypothetical protein
MEFHDPRGVLTGPVDDYRGAARLAPGDTIGLFANGFPDSVAFCEHLARALQAELAGIEVRVWNKGNASALASAEQLAEIAGACTAVVAAYGH